TRLSRDWSSDVCSSDLVREEHGGRRGAPVGSVARELEAVEVPLPRGRVGGGGRLRGGGYGCRQDAGEERQGESASGRAGAGHGHDIAFVTGVIWMVRLPVRVGVPPMTDCQTSTCTGPLSEPGTLPPLCSCRVV